MTLDRTNRSKSIWLALGGARSGKTAWAEARALELAATAKPFYLATGQAFDEEMQARIDRHQRLRQDQFTTLEEPVAIDQMIAQRQPGETMLIDSVGTWITNLMLAEADIDAATDAVLESVMASPASLVFVSDETGLGIVPDNAMARAFRDHIGAFNQRLAAIADGVTLIVAGIPVVIKPQS